MRKKIQQQSKKNNKKAMLHLARIGISAAIFISIVIAGHLSKTRFSPIEVTAQTSAALKFDPANVSASVGNQFTVNVIVDTGGAEVLSTDAYITFDSTKFQAVSVQNGTFFPSTTHTIQNSSLVLRGIVTEPASFKQGTGVLGTITFKALQSGTSAMNFYCNLQAGDTSKIIQNGIDAQNIISCSANTSLTVTIGSSTTITSSPVPTFMLSPTVPNPTITRFPDGDGDDDDGEDDDGLDDDGKDDDGKDDDGKDDIGNDGKDDDGLDDDGLDDDGKDDDGLDDDGLDDDGVPDAKGSAKANLITLSLLGGGLIAAYFVFASRKI